MIAFEPFNQRESGSMIVLVLFKMLFLIPIQRFRLEIGDLVFKTKALTVDFKSSRCSFRFNAS